MAANAQVPVSRPIVKSDQIKRIEAMKEIQQLKIKVQNFEREKATHLYAKHGDFRKEFATLEEMEMKATEEIKSEKIRINQQLTRIKTSVKKFHRELQDVKPTPEFVEKLKVLMEEIEGYISSFKENQKEKYEELMREERLTHTEVLALDKKFDSWSQAPAAKIISKESGAVPKSHRDSERDLPPEVKTFERFVLQHGGVRGGWDEYDHGTFLKFRNRHKGRLAFIDELVSHLPTRNRDEIKHHEAWFQEYNSLNLKKKEAIQKWKEKREEEKETELAGVDESDSEDEQERERQAMKRAQIEAEKRERKMQLNSWKVQKELERAEEDERKLRDQLRKAQEEERKIQEQMIAKEKVIRYKKQKDLEKREQEMEEEYKERMEIEERQKRAAFIIPRFRDRDMTAAQRKLEKEKKKEEEKKAKEQRLERARSNIKVERDPSRLLKPTKGWEERQKSVGPSGGGAVLHMPTRAVPSWRQGLH